MRKKIAVPDSFNFCDPADWCDFCDLPGQIESNSEEYPRINASERMKVIKRLIDNSNSPDSEEQVDSIKKKVIRDHEE